VVYDISRAELPVGICIISLITNPLRGHTSAITSTFTTSGLGFGYCCDPLPILQQRARDSIVALCI
jgi:hypothetical protein